ncbi:MAG: bifunctional (p)ppGpp synthetase/guanosine-3',5'-bis(diphosphate) 3'-pyrophosphohydrolase [Bacteroidales bacterium]|nr:MAG: bifunctional (p)ppGpp synthetase/guanosine-3',5'-bis(diphosphate) 3'-pyrophosphohydrolase [Bacteroidales bacterium]
MEKYSEIESRKIVNAYRGLLRAARGVVSKENQKQVRKAFNLATGLNRGIKRESGQLNIFHLIGVARICVEEMGLGSTSIISALLHETLKRGQLTYAQIDKQFGSNVATIVEGITKVSGLDPKNPKKQAENFRELLLSISKDVRVILVKIAERQETMRSLSSMPNDIQLRQSLITFYLYAPLAHRLGLYRIKSEMEDLAMKYSNPEEYRAIIKKLKNTNAKRNKFIKEFIDPIQEALIAKGFEFDIKGRTKSVYSIWKKMQKQGVEFEEVYDLFAIRIILNSSPEREKSDCWQVYSIITDKYTPNPERLRDWISVPKNNGYESLHTTVVSPEGRFVEVQIRTNRMDLIAENGLAAHWKYKGIKQEQNIETWLTGVREILDNTDSSPEEFVEEFKANLYTKEIFIFTPNGDLRKFPTGATVLDFAFDIHTNIGCQCVGAKINNTNASIRQVLNNGDVVEIITSKNQKPKEDWLNVVLTSKAKGRIKQSLREEKNKEIVQGKEILYRRFKNWKITDNEEALKIIQKHLKIKSQPEVFSLIANEKVDISSFKSIILNPEKKETPNADEKTKTIEPKSILSSDDFLIIDEKFVNIEYKLAKCCNPIFGDNVFGFVTIGEGVKIHRINCPNAAQLNTRWGYRIVKAKWKESKATASFQTTIKINGFDELGIVNKISEVISTDLKVNMRSISINTKDGLFEGRIQVFVSDIKNLEMLLYKLNKIKGVQKAVRMK